MFVRVWTMNMVNNAIARVFIPPYIIHMYTVYTYRVKSSMHIIYCIGYEKLAKGQSVLKVFRIPTIRVPYRKLYQFLHKLSLNMRLRMVCVTAYIPPSTRHSNHGHICTNNFLFSSVERSSQVYTSSTATTSSTNGNGKDWTEKKNGYTNQNFSKSWLNYTICCSFYK